MASSGKNASFSEINITPLTDVFLVLLVVVMIAAPVTNQQRDIAPPMMTQSVMIDDSWPVVEVNSKGEIFSNGVQVMESGLDQHLASLLPKDGAKNLVVRGDRKAQSGKVMAIMESAQRAQFESVFISGELERNPGGAPAGGE